MINETADTPEERVEADSVGPSPSSSSTSPFALSLPDPPPSADAEKVYDFTTRPVDAPEAMVAYSMLRRKAKIMAANVEAAERKEIMSKYWPDGRKMTKGEIETLLGKTLAELFIAAKCCGK